MLTTTTTPTIGTSLDRLLAPLDDLYPVTDLPSPADAERAYAIGMLAADLTKHAPSSYLLALCRHLGWEEGEALTIARAVASLVVRIAQRTGHEQG